MLQILIKCFERSISNQKIFIFLQLKFKRTLEKKKLNSKNRIRFCEYCLKYEIKLNNKYL